mgnify:CR=1 FL=1
MIPSAAARQLLDVLVYASPQLDLWCGTHHVAGAPRLFEYASPRQLPLDLVCQLRDGSLTKWQALFTVKSSFSAVSRVDHDGSMSGHKRPVVRLLRHPSRPCLLTVGADETGAELLVWSTEPQSRLGLRSASSLHLLVRHELPPSGPVQVAWVPSIDALELLLATGDTLALLSVFQATPTSSMTVQTHDLRAHLPDANPADLHVHVVPEVDACLVVLVDAALGQLHLWRLACQSLPTIETPEAPLIVQPREPRSSCEPTVLAAGLPLGLPSSGRGLLAERVTVLHSSLVVDTTSAVTAALPTTILLTAGCSDGLVRVWHATAAGTASQCASLDIAPPEGAAPSVSLLRASGCSRALVCWAAAPAAPARRGSVAGDAVHAVVFECQSDPSRFRPEYTLDLREPVQDAAWYDHPMGGAMLAVVTPHALQLYTQLLTSLAGNWRSLLRVELADQAPGPRTVAWSFGSLIVGCARELVLFGQHLQQPPRQTLTAARSARQQQGDSIFKQAERINGSLASYHPDMLFDMLLAGKFQQAQMVLHHLLAASVSTAAAGDDALAVPALRVSELLTVADEPATQAEPLSHARQDGGAMGTADYDALFAGSTSEFEEAAANVADPDQLTNDHFKDLRTALMQRSLPRLDRSEQVKLLALIEAYADIHEHLGALDNCGARFFVAERMGTFLTKALPQNRPDAALQSSDFVWAFHSESQEQLIQLSSTVLHHASTYGWPELRLVGCSEAGSEEERASERAREEEEEEEEEEKKKKRRRKEEEMMQVRWSRG